MKRIKIIYEFIKPLANAPGCKSINLDEEKLKLFEDEPLLSNLISRGKVTLTSNKVWYNEDDEPTYDLLQDFLLEKSNIDINLSTSKEDINWIENLSDEEKNKIFKVFKYEDKYSDDLNELFLPLIDEGFKIEYLANYTTLDPENPICNPELDYRDDFYEGDAVDLKKSTYPSYYIILRKYFSENNIDDDNDDRYSYFGRDDDDTPRDFLKKTFFGPKSDEFKSKYSERSLLHQTKIRELENSILKEKQKIELHKMIDLFADRLANKFNKVYFKFTLKDKKLWEIEFIMVDSAIPEEQIKKMYAVKREDYLDYYMGYSSDRIANALDIYNSPVTKSLMRWRGRTIFDKDYNMSGDLGQILFYIPTTKKEELVSKKTWTRVWNVNKDKIKQYFEGSNFSAKFYTIGDKEFSEMVKNFKTKGGYQPLFLIEYNRRENIDEYNINNKLSDHFTYDGDHLDRI